MENSKLLQLLSTFSKSELREFKDFTASPFFNKNEELVLFYSYLHKYAPHFPPHKIKREVVYKSLFPEEKYQDKRFKYLMSFLLKLAEQFIGIKQYQATPLLGEYHQLSSFITRNLDKHFHYHFKQSNKLLQKFPFQNADFFQQQFLLADVASKYFSRQKIRKHDDHLQQSTDYFDLYYLTKKLKYSCELLNRKLLVKGKYSLKLVKEIQEYLTGNKHEEPAINIYYQILMTLTEEKADKHFIELKKLLQQFQDKFPDEERREMLLYALNFSIRQTNRGKQNYIEESFNLYVNGIESGLLFDGPRLSPWAFKNVIRLGLMLQRFAWVETFIEAYNAKQATEFQHNGYHYNMADLFYSKKEFDKAQQHLAQVEYNDIYITLDSKKLLMKIYYESEETEALHSAITSFNMYLSRNKIIAQNVRDHYKNFTYILGLLLKGEERQKTRNRLDAMQSIADRKWLRLVVSDW